MASGQQWRVRTIASATGLRLTTPLSLALDSRSVAACAVLLPRQEVPCSVDASARRRRPRRPLARAERRALFAKLAERPEHICPFLGLVDERAGYVEGVSDDHRCYAFGDPAPLSAEQQTRVCQERGYGNCPRYLRGVLVIPTEELEALRRPRAPLPEPVRSRRPPPPRRRRRAAPAPLSCCSCCSSSVAGQPATWCFGKGLFPVAVASSSPSPTPAADAASRRRRASAPSAALEPTDTPRPRIGAWRRPTPEPTPSAGDTFAFYEVSVGPRDYTLFRIDADGEIVDTPRRSFDGFSVCARPNPRNGADGDVYWVTAEGGLTALVIPLPGLRRPSASAPSS